MNFFMFLCCSVFISIAQTQPVIVKDIYGRTDIRHWPPSYGDDLCYNSWHYGNGRYTTCQPEDTRKKQNCTQETHPYNVSQANIVYAKIKAESRSCASQKFLKNKHGSCQENFKVYYSLKNSLNQIDKLIFALDIPGPVTYNIEGMFATKVIFFSTEVKDFHYITYFWNSQYFCGNVESFQVYYYQCQSTSSHLVDFPVVSSPATGEKIIYGQCTLHSLQISSGTPYQTCQPNGTSDVFGSCQCVPGYEKKGNTCQACPLGTFKSNQGNNGCQKCGANSNSRKSSQTSCECSDGFYRALPDVERYETPCYLIPLEISGRIDARILSLKTAIIEWEDNGNGTTEYIFKCQLCSKKVVFTKRKYVYLDKLNGFTRYKVSVAVSNVNTNITGRFNTKEFYFSTSVDEVQCAENSCKNDGVCVHYDQLMHCNCKLPWFGQTCGDNLYSKSMEVSYQMEDTNKFDIDGWKSAIASSFKQFCSIASCSFLFYDKYHFRDVTVHDFDFSKSDVLMIYTVNQNVVKIFFVIQKPVDMQNISNGHLSKETIKRGMDTFAEKLAESQNLILISYHYQQNVVDESKKKNTSNYGYIAMIPVVLIIIAVAGVLYWKKNIIMGYNNRSSKNMENVAEMKSIKKDNNTDECQDSEAQYAFIDDYTNVDAIASDKEPMVCSKGDDETVNTYYR